MEAVDEGDKSFFAVEGGEGFDEVAGGGSRLWL